jgi:hypothetical protein
MRPAQLTAIKDGINRLRPKGGARADSLYDLLNAYVTAERTVVGRPGTRRAARLPAGTVGLVAFEGVYHVFSHADVDLAGLDDYQLSILLHPTNPDAELVRIHYATPFLGALYVVAEFSDEAIFHFWLQAGTTWTADTEYSANQFATPTAPNGYVYRAIRFGDPYQAWGPGVPRAVADVIEPTTYNEYYYTVVVAEGDNPRSAQVEPIWPTNTGERITENADDTTAAQNVSVNPPTPPPPNTPQASTTDRYEL